MHKGFVKLNPARIKNLQKMNSSISPEEPTLATFKEALQAGYGKVIYQTHGDSDATIQFEGGTRAIRQSVFVKLSSLKTSGDADKINAKVVGIACCYPNAVAADWASINLKMTTFKDLSVHVPGKETTYRDANTRNVWKEIYAGTPAPGLSRDAVGLGIDSRMGDSYRGACD